MRILNWRYRMYKNEEIKTSVTIRDLEKDKLYRLKDTTGWVQIKEVYSKENPHNPHSKKKDCALCLFLKREKEKPLYEALYEVSRIRKDLNKLYAGYYKESTETREVIAWKEKTAKKVLRSILANTKQTKFSVLVYKQGDWSWAIEADKKRVLVYEKTNWDNLSSGIALRNEVEIALPDCLFDFRDLTDREKEKVLDFLIEEKEAIETQIVSFKSKLS